SRSGGGLSSGGLGSGLGGGLSSGGLGGGLGGSMGSSGLGGSSFIGGGGAGSSGGASFLGSTSGTGNGNSRNRSGGQPVGSTSFMGLYYANPLSLGIASANGTLPTSPTFGTALITVPGSGGTTGSSYGGLAGANGIGAATGITGNTSM